MAAQFVRDHGWDEGKSRQIYQAISLHLNPSIDASIYSAEEASVGAAATLDLLGLHHQRPPVEVIWTVNTQYDQTNLDQSFAKRMKQHHHHTDTRACFYANVGATKFIAQNPLNRLEFGSLQPPSAIKLYP